MIDTTTVFPDQIDSRRYFSDAQIHNKEAITLYETLLNQKDYDSASALLSTGKYNGTSYDVPFSFEAALPNMFTERLYAIETYLNGRTKVNICNYGSSEPSDVSINYVWIE